MDAAWQLNGHSHPDHSAEEDHLLHLSKRFIDLFNARAYLHPQFSQHVAPEARFLVMGLSHMSMNRVHGTPNAGFLRGHKLITDGVPHFHANVVNASAVLDRDAHATNGTTILSLDLTGYTTQTKQAATIWWEWRWDRRRGLWVCRDARMLYGTPEFL